MRKKDLLIVQDSDFLGEMPGGIKSFWKGFLRNMPEDYNVEVIGVSSNTNLRPLNRWIEVAIGAKKVKFLPVSAQKNEAALSFFDFGRFLVGLICAKINYLHKVICFDRLGTAAALFLRNNTKWMIIHCEMDRVVCRRKNRWRLLGLFIPLYFMLERIIYKRMDYIYSTSRTTIEDYHRRYPKLLEKVGFLPVSFDTSLFVPSHTGKQVIRSHLRTLFPSIPEVNKWILYAGRLAEVKNLPLLLDVFVDYRHINPDSFLLILGDGPMLSALQKLIVIRQLERSVLLLGFLPQERCVDFYRASDVFLFTSLSEAGPIVIMEALGCGLPVVSTDVGEVGQFVKSGFSGEVRNNRNELVEALQLVLDHPERYSMQNCVSSVMDHAPQKAFGPLYQLLNMNKL